MGKPAITRSKSEHSLDCSVSKIPLPTQKMNVPMSFQKMEKKRRRKRNRTKNNIQKLFNNLRSESHSSFDSMVSDNSVIELDKTLSKKRQLPEENTDDPENKRRKTSNNSLIIINDDNDVPEHSSTTPRKTSTVQCSTPIPNKNKNELQQFITSNKHNSNNNNTSQNFNEDGNILNTSGESFVTIDLTTETLHTTVNKTSNTVIDLVNNTDNADCTILSFSQSNMSMSGDSDVTILNVSKKKVTKEKQMRRFANGISKLDASEKGRLLELITQNIFAGCSVPSRRCQLNIGRSTTQATETVEADTYIKEVILGQTASRNSIGSNIYNPECDVKNKTGLRMVVIDGSNVAMEHGRGKVFSVKGLRICIDYFVKRGHTVKAFVPRFRCKFGKSSEPRLLDELERRGLVVYTPSREIQGRTVASYDDRYIVQCAAEFDGVIVSGDNYRDLLQENPRWRSVIENRVLPFTWVEDMIMFPRDPLGRNGPTLEQFMRHVTPKQTKP